MPTMADLMVMWDPRTGKANAHCGDQSYLCYDAATIQDAEGRAREYFRLPRPEDGILLAEWEQEVIVW